jgi:hypothetical protein
MMLDQGLFWDLFRDRIGAVDHFHHLPSFGLSFINLVCPLSRRI